MKQELDQSPLGKATTYADQYQPSLLFPIPRKHNRAAIGIGDALPFQGTDIWNAYELSWLNPEGKPIVAIAECEIPCLSPNLVESKSFKLYLNSFNNTRFDSLQKVKDTLIQDLSAAAGAQVSVILHELYLAPVLMLTQFDGICLDTLHVTCDTYTTQPAYLKAAGEIVTETLHSNLLRSNCPITGQPDWGSVQISYTGKQIEHAGLLKYIVSLRNHDEFHEQCVERMFMDITTHCAPEKLFVYARYTRRGGLDINPWRSSHPIVPLGNQRLCRQ